VACRRHEPEADAEHPCCRAGADRHPAGQRLLLSVLTRSRRVVPKRAPACSET
jgi:hypothetical protein